MLPGVSPNVAWRAIYHTLTCYYVIIFVLCFVVSVLISNYVHVFTLRSLLWLRGAVCLLGLQAWVGAWCLYSWVGLG